MLLTPEPLVREDQWPQLILLAVGRRALLMVEREPIDASHREPLHPDIMLELVVPKPPVEPLVEGNPEILPEHEAEARHPADAVRALGELDLELLRQHRLERG